MPIRIVTFVRLVVCLFSVLVATYLPSSFSRLEFKFEIPFFSLLLSYSDSLREIDLFLSRFCNRLRTWIGKWPRRLYLRQKSFK